MTSRRARLAAVAVLCALTGACTSSTDTPDLGPDAVGTDISVVTVATTTAGPLDTAVEALPDTVAPTGKAAVPAEPLRWTACHDPKAADPTMQCAIMSVPLDYADPASPRIGIALVRIPAIAQRVGAVLVNPGGPGASGFDFVAFGGARIGATLGLDQFDLIGFDPRGVDRSNGLRCLDDAQQDAIENLDDTPDTPQEQAAADAADTMFQTACLAKYGDTLRHYSTANTARDMDAIRAGLGDQQISLLGLSYGTYLFATYATLFPASVRAMVLDSAYDPNGDTIEQQYTTQIVGFERAFTNWSDWCAGTESCSFRSADVGADWDGLATQLDATPVTATDGRSANETVMRTATLWALYNEANWPVLADALTAVRGGDPTGLFALADSSNGRASDGRHSTIEQSFDIIRCASGLDAAVPDDPAALVAALQRVAPRFSKGLTVDDFEDSCALLVGDPTPVTLSYRGDAPVVVVNGTNDPATPIRWAQKMRSVIGVDTRLVSYTGEGHGVLDSSICGAQIEAAVLVALTPPATDTTCAPDPIIERPAWWGGLPVPADVSAIINAPDVALLLGFGPTLAYTEVRTSPLSPAEVLDQYDGALGAAGFVALDRLQPAPGVSQGVYRHGDDDVLGIVTFGPEALSEPGYAPLASMVPSGETLIVLLTRPG